MSKHIFSAKTFDFLSVLQFSLDKLFTLSVHSGPFC